MKFVKYMFIEVCINSLNELNTFPENWAITFN